MSEGDKTKVAFVRKLDKGYAVVVELSKENEKIMLHKTFFYKDSAGKRTPFKNKPSIKEKWSVDGSTTISPIENQQPADTENISALDQSSASKGTENSGTNKKTETKKPQKSKKKVSKQRVGGSMMSMEADATEMMMRDALVETMESAGIEVVTDVAIGQQVLDDANGEARLMGGEMSERRKEREEVNNYIDEATSFVTGKDIKDVRRERIAREEQRRELTKEIYGIILSGDFNSVNLQKISDYINDVTPNNPYGRRLSKRLPQRVERKSISLQSLSAVDALYGRAAESAVSPHERVSAQGRRAIEERKKEALEQWAKATGMPSSATLQIAEFKALQSIWTSGLQGAKIGHSSGFQTSRE